MFIAKWLIAFLRPIIDHFPHLAALYRGMRDQLQGMEPPKATPWGFKLAGNDSMAQGNFEPVETELVRNVLNDVDILVNVGANVGYYCCHALSMGKSAIAFEPMERNLHYLCKNIKSNAWDGVEIFPVALSDHVGILEIYGGNTGASVVKGWAGIPESYMTLVPCSTMDMVLGTRLQGKRALVLVDIEGAEKWMLEGAKLMLANEPKPVWMVEIVTRENQPSGVEINPNFLNTFEFFFQHGYEAFSADQNMRPVSMDDAILMSKGLLKADTYNFLFREAREAQ